MPPESLILVLNTGSTSTKVALAAGARIRVGSNLPCPAENAGIGLPEQVRARRMQAVEFLLANGVEVAQVAAIAARGGPLQPTHGGVYKVNEAMLADARSDRFIPHPARLACLVGHEMGEPHAIPCFTVDPISTDEFDAVARVSGMPRLPRRALAHALNMKRAAREFARQRGATYEALNLITAHLGGGISVAVHSKGRMVDSVDSNGEGPMSPERSGGLRVDDLARDAVSSGLAADDYIRDLTRSGGLAAHLGTSDARAVEARISKGDAQAELVFGALAYQVSKAIAGLAAVTAGAVDGVILTGGLACSGMLTAWIGDRVRYLAPVVVYPGEFEMEALAEGVARVLEGKEKPRCYPSGNII